MGTDIDAAFGHQCEFPPTEELVRSMCSNIDPVGPVLTNDWTAKAGYIYLRLFLVQSSNLSIYFGPRTAFISSGYGWPYSASDQDLAKSVASAIISIARFFRSPQVIFFPDDIEPWCNMDCWISDGASLEDLRMRLAEIKGPSTGFSGAIKQWPDYWEVNGYFIEELKYDDKSCTI